MEALKPHHEQSVREYLRFTRYKRSECVRSVSSYFDSLIEAHLVEDTTFSTSEVRDMLNGMWSAVKSEIETELMSSAHLSTLLLQQLLQQADEVHLRMKINVAELENKELLEGIATYEQQVLSENTSSFTKTQLQPLNFGGDNLLKKENDKVTEENIKLLDRVKMLESKVSAVLKENQKLKTESSPKWATAVSETVTQDTEEVTRLREEVSVLRLKISQNEPMQTSERNHKETKEELLRVKGELERTKAELDRKFKDTSQFNTMKKLLETKNKQIAELREQLK